MTVVGRAACGLMARTATDTVDLRKGADVVARTALRDVPEGTAGKVTMVTGLTWIRYWVRFDNGISLGTIDRKRLATPEEWQRFLDGDEEVEGTVATPVATPVAVSADGGGAEEADSAGGATTTNGTYVPQKHIDRAKAARARLST